MDKTLTFKKEIRELPVPDLLKRVEDARNELYEMRVKSKTGQMEKSADIRKKKKEIARILTELRSRPEKAK
ncbi:MAG: 50S ribosomal protein L29 [Candidatus Aureabacteria bacterium]|nr:50S ribosomal protein L29 [Candidatus Auribacterota bacterium]